MNINLELCVFGRLLILRNDGLLPRGLWFGRNWHGFGDGANSKTWHCRSWTLWSEDVSGDTGRTGGFLLELGAFRVSVGQDYAPAV